MDIYLIIVKMNYQKLWKEFLDNKILIKKQSRKYWIRSKISIGVEL